MNLKRTKIKKKTKAPTKKSSSRPGPSRSPLSGDLARLVGSDVYDLPLIKQLFKASGVKWKRTNSRGESYSIAEQSLEEFLRWDFMPWE